MSTGNTPNPPDTPTGDTSPSLAADVAGIIEREADTLAQRLVYHSQTMYGVGAVGVDVVSARNSALVFANALRNNATAQADHTLMNVGESQAVQINDGTLPFKNNVQVAGLLEGLIIDTVARAYAEDPATVRAARTMLDGLFQSANEKMQHQSRALVQLHGPNARR